MPEWTRAKDLEITGGRTITIEVQERFGENSLADARTWVVSKANTRHREVLPVPKPTEDVPFDFDRFAISPDDYAIIASRKVAHGTNEMRVLHRVGDLRYRPAEKQSLNDRIGKRYGLPKEWRAPGLEQSVDIIRFQRWLPDGRHAVLACLYIGEKNKQIFYLVTLDTHSGNLTDYHRVPERDVK